MQCAATSKQSGERCRRHAVPGRRVCASHGGKTPRGAASPHFRHGKFSKSVPERLAAWFVAEGDAAPDPDRLSVRDDLALVDAVIGDLLLRLDDDAPAEQRAIRREIRQTIEIRRRLVEAEVRRVSQRGRVLTRAEAETLVVGLVAAVRTHVFDPQVLGAISKEIEGLMDRGPPG